MKHNETTLQQDLINAIKYQIQHHQQQVINLEEKLGDYLLENGLDSVPNGSVEEKLYNDQVNYHLQKEHELKVMLRQY